MQPADLNLTTTIVGHQLFLFVTFGLSPDTGGADGEMIEALKLLGHGMENIHDVDGPPTEEVFKYDLLQSTYGGRLTILSEVAEAVREKS